MDMRVRGKRPHGQKEVGGPTLKTCVSWVSGCRKPEGPRRLFKRCIPRAKVRPARKKIPVRGIGGLILASPCSWRLFFTVSAAVWGAGWARSISPHRVAICSGFSRRWRAAP
jgi:hypothetical protein